MSRYIDADVLVDELEEVFRMRDDISKGGLSEAMEIVHNMPTVDAVPVVHGRWVERMITLDWCENVVDIIYICSECEGNNFCETSFCPHCGAKMDGKEE